MASGTCLTAVRDIFVSTVIAPVPKTIINNSALPVLLVRIE